MCDMTHQCMTWLMTPSYVTWLIHRWRDPFIGDMLHSIDLKKDKALHNPDNTTHPYASWLIHMWHDSFICDMTHSYVTWLNHMWHGSIICDLLYSIDLNNDKALDNPDNTTHPYVTWLIHVWHDSSTYDMTHSCVMCFSHMSLASLHRSAEWYIYIALHNCSVLQCVTVFCSVLQCGYI